ncbi:lamin tail domain-containing protein [Oceanithermus sp.]
MKTRTLARLGWILMVFVLWIHVAGVVEAQTVRDFQREYTNAGSEFRGNLLSIGNALVTCSSCGQGAGEYNSFKQMVYVDVDSDGSTSNSSRATLNLPAGSQVEYAALVWGARTQTASGNKTIRFKLPGSTSYTTVTSDWAEYLTSYSPAAYAAYADVTGLLQGLADPNGDYWGAGIDAVVGYSDGLGYYGGWALLVVYRNAGETYRTITVDAGYAKVADGDSIDIDIANLNTPVTGSYLFRLAAIVWEGDDGSNVNSLKGDQLLVGPQPGTLSNVSDSQNPADDFWNSSISHLGARFTDKNPDYVNQLGFDADTVELSNLPPGIDTIRTHYTTNGDHYFPQVLGTSTGLAIIKGTVYEDVDGDGSLADAVAVPNVTVMLYQDDGDGVPDAGDTQVPGQTVSTTPQGEYSFQNIPDGDYWVVVDSRSVAPNGGFNSGFAQGDVWAEQTYGAGGAWGGALCDADADGSTAAVARASNGVCFGGRRGHRSDDSTALTSAEHVAKVGVHGSVVTGVDFGFSFNVVTNTNDQDDDPAENRSAQGSLRQFIQNSDAIAGGNTMRFTPVVPANSGSWWTINVEAGNPLPAITDDATTINGAAYDYTDGTSTRDTNAGSILAPGTVGVSETLLADYAKPELEVNVNDAGVGLAVAASNTEIARLALYNSEAAYSAALIQVTSGSSNKVHDSFLGARADGSDPQGDDRARAGVTVKPGGQMDVRHNYIAHLYNTGVELQGTGVVEENLIEHIGMMSYCGDGVSFEGGPQRNRDDVKVQYNYIHDIAAYGVESWRAPGAYYIYENTITDTGKGDREGNYCGGTSGDINTTERGGIRIFGTGSLVERNVVYGAPGHAIVVVPVDSDTPSLQNTITQNSTYANGGLSIDLDQGDGSGNPNGDGVTPNDGAASSSQQNNGMDYPIFTSAVVSGSQLRVQGYVGKDSSRLSGTFTIEVYKADDDGNNNGEVEEGDGLSVSHGEGRWYLGRCETDSDGSFDCLLDLSSLSGDAVPDSGDAIAGTATDGDGNTSEFGANKRVFVVEKSLYAGKIVINEVLYRQSANSADENDEFIEIYNAGDGAVNLEGWRLGDGNVPLGTTDGVSYQFPSVTLDPGEYAVIWVGNQYDARQDAAGAAFQAWLGYASKLNNTGDDVQLFDAEGNAVDYVAYGSGSTVDPPPIADFWDSTYQSGLAGAALGQSISLTPNGVDGDTSACWEKTTSGDAYGRCSGYLPTVDSDDYGSRVTSVGANNNGVTVSGYVYHDLEPDGARGGSESWSDGPAVYVKLVRDGAVVQVVAVAAGSDGAYAFTAVEPGDYTLVVDDNNDTGDVSPSAPAGWLFVNPSDGSRTVTVGTADVSGVDFGLFHGARVLGTVFHDTGDGAGTANDAVQNGAEPGVAGVSVTASDGANARTVQTGVEGDYTIYIPADWGSVTLSHALRPASGRNVNGSSVYQVASWQEASATDSSVARFDLGSASGLAGQELVGYNFGAVFASAFRPDQSGSATSPGAVTYAHTYQPGTQGTVELSREGGDYRYQVRVDQNCNGDFEDSGEDWQAVSPGENPTFGVGDGWPRNPDGSFRACGVEVRVLVPDGEPERAVDIAQVSAALRWASNAGVADSREVVDTTTVRTLGTLQLEKQVRNVTQNSDFGNQVEGKPGDVLEYCISYRNIGSENVTDVVISDPIPFFSDFLYGAYTSNTDILWYEASGSNQNLTADPSDGDAGKVESGIVSVTAESTLEPGQGGKVCYQVKIR